jgi:peptidoglycan/xylan/chitin deacetylase (PgdA/CDA1 family)
MSSRFRPYAYVFLGLLLGTMLATCFSAAKKTHTEILALITPTVTPSPEPAAVTPAQAAGSPSPSIAPPPGMIPAPTPTPPAPVPSAPTPEAPVLAVPTGPEVIKRAAAVDANIIVLGYHQFSAPGTKPSNIYMMAADTFESEMKYLKDNGYTVVSLNDLERFLKKEIPLPRRTVVITIDDGYHTVYKWAYPILKKYQFPWTFFVYPDYVNASTGSITWDQLREMRDAGVDIQSHSKSHPLLTHKRGKTDEQYEAWLHDEIVTSKGIIEKEVGRPVTRFAYPYGDWNKHIEKLVLEAGFTSIYTVAGNPVTQATPARCVGRFIITRQNERLFSSYLNQIALGLVDASPAAGDTVEDARPIIKVRLAYAGTIDPKSVEMEASGFGKLPIDFDPMTQTVRGYLQRDIVQRTLRVEVRLRDAETKRQHQATWQFNYGKKNDSPLTPEEQMMTPPTSAPAPPTK